MGAMQLLLDLVGRTPDALPTGISEEKRPAQRTSAGFVATNPIASRQALLGDTAVSYQLRRRKRRTIGFVVGADGLVVSAPKWVPLYEIDAAVREKSAWILARLHEMREREARMQATRIAWRDGATLPYLGQAVTVVLGPQHRFDEAGAVLHVGLPNDAQPAQIRDAVQAWLMKEARRVFTERLDHFAARLGVQWRKLSLSGASTRWGSASADGSIRLNWRLIHFRTEVIDYVVAHELSHLRVMDHSPRFWETVQAVVPDYAQLRSQLTDEALPRWD